MTSDQQKLMEYMNKRGEEPSMLLGQEMTIGELKQRWPDESCRPGYFASADAMADADKCQPFYELPLKFHPEWAKLTASFVDSLGLHK